jgi:hypothetical protein
MVQRGAMQRQARAEQWVYEIVVGVGVRGRTIGDGRDRSASKARGQIQPGATIALKDDCAAISTEMYIRDTIPLMLP